MAFEFGVLIPILASLLAIGFAWKLTQFILKQSPGNRKMREIAGMVQEGAMAFLNSEYRPLSAFVITIAVILTAAGFAMKEMSPLSGLVFAIGAVLSALTGNVGMRIATSSNSRTAQAVKRDMKSGLLVAFSSGAVMGMCVVGLGLLGVSVLFVIMDSALGLSRLLTTEILFSFGFGASSIALFARVGGGIYTKSADVGADLVGKVEAGIPEDDPRNPAVIADNVGDNVGDVAGMGADLFESYVDSIIAAMALGVLGVAIMGGDQMLNSSFVVLPMVLAGLGILSSILGSLLVTRIQGSDAHKIMNTGIIMAAVLTAILSGIAVWAMIGRMAVWGAMLAGLASGLVIGYSTEYYTSDKRAPAQGISKASTTGPATNIIQGLSLGMLSTIIPILAVSAAILISYKLSDLYGIAIAAVGMLSTLGITLATDTYGPVADNAAGIAEMAGMGKEVRERAEALDAVGNTTAAIGKGFAIGSAALTALALFSTYSTKTQLPSINLMQPEVVVGLFLGGLLPFVFSALTMSAVGKAAMDMVEEVRRQFRQIPGLMEGKAKPDSKRCVEISTKAALRQMIIPGLLAVVAPVTVGFALGVEALAGLLAGATVTGFLLAVFMANAGGAWDNAKKYIESGHYGGKGKNTHKAAVVGDTVGDPFKDTSGPSLNILIKLMSIVSLVFIPLFLAFGG